MKNDVELIKEKIDLVEFLRGYVDLSPSGRNFKALCPFHQEKTPSFFVSPEKKIWHCFGCGLGGDVIKFVMLYEHLEFPEALRFLGEKVGIEISRLSQREQKEFDILYEIYKLAVEFYKEKLRNAGDALNYLYSRGLKDETIEEFELGFAPKGEELTKYLLNKGYNVNYIMKAGLTQKTKSGLYEDRFQKRIVFPIANYVGKFVAFTGRILPNDRGEDPEDVPKYLNSPETIIFNKSKVLYGLHKAKSFISEKKEVIIVEGQMDLLMMWQTGFKNVVAVSGTGLTEEHLLRLRRLADNVVISFDKDEAGLKALERSLRYFYKFDFHVKVLDLKEYKDPALAAQKDANLLIEQVQNAQPAFRYLMNVYIDDNFQNKDILFKKKVIRKLLGLISFLSSALERREWLKELSLKTYIKESDLEEELHNLGIFEEITRESLENVEKLREFSYADILRRLFVLSLTNEKLFSIIQNEIKQFSGEIIDLWANLNEERAVLELEAEYVKNYFDPKLIEREHSDLLKKLKVFYLRKVLDDLKKRIKEVEKKGDMKELDNLLLEFYRKRQEINKIRNIGI